MTEETAPVVAHVGEGVIEFPDGTRVPISAAPMPVVYFDNAPTLSHLNGVIGITLIVTSNVPMGDGGVKMVASVAAHLKCNIPAAQALKGALENALLLAQPVDNPGGKSN
ncbi:hypothetical protein [Bradyrhizobium sp. SZCCHNR2032]|uniref:hypothetical protein n=1 Tax=Bradyrhizobium sp. SZCCHNR2032 TaxID=3057384 RepID=UPI00291646C0|nr:hypothetical protein [Bradyrhizobium sp. SZCCHNR2032]